MCLISIKSVFLEWFRNVMQKSRNGKAWRNTQVSSSVRQKKRSYVLTLRRGAQTAVRMENPVTLPSCRAQERRMVSNNKIGSHMNLTIGLVLKDDP